jgi:hypothetical protein
MPPSRETAATNQWVVAYKAMMISMKTASIVVVLRRFSAPYGVQCLAGLLVCLAYVPTARDRHAAVTT